MKSRKARPAVSAALRYISERLERDLWPAGSRLPALDELAKDAGVSLVSMWKAVRLLSARKVLHVQRGTGIYRGAKPAVVHATADDLVRRITADLFHGAFHNDDVLPSTKELMKHYGVGFRTLKTALARLIADGHCTRRNRTLVPRRMITASSTQASILLITGSDLLVQCESSYWRSTAELFMHYFELQCARRNVRVIRAIVEKGTRDEVRAASDTLGCVVWANTVVQAILPELLGHLRRLGQKAAVFYHHNQGDLAEKFSLASDNEMHLSIDDDRAGFTVGTSLLERGHSSVCYFSYLNQPWARERYQALVRAFSEAGHADAVHWFTEESVLPQPFATGIPPLESERRQATEDRRAIESLRSTVMNSTIAAPYRFRLISRIEETSFWRWLYQALEPAMESALSNATATAWVAADDFVGLYALLPYLRSRRIAVPGDLSVVGVNDQFETAYHGLSSYHFDMIGMAMRILTFLLYPAQDSRIRTPVRGMEGIPGFLMDRGSLGRPSTNRPVRSTPP